MTQPVLPAKPWFQGRSGKRAPLSGFRTEKQKTHLVHQDSVWAGLGVPFRSILEEVQFFNCTGEGLFSKAIRSGNWLVTLKIAVRAENP